MRFVLALAALACIACNEPSQQAASDPHVCVDSRTNKVVGPEECTRSYGSSGPNWFMWYMIGQSAGGFHYPAYGSYLGPQSPNVRGYAPASNFVPAARKTSPPTARTTPPPAAKPAPKAWAQSPAAKPTYTSPKPAYRSTPYRSSPSTGGGFRRR